MAGQSFAQSTGLQPEKMKMVCEIVKGLSDRKSGMTSESSAYIEILLNGQKANSDLRSLQAKLNELVRKSQNLNSNLENTFAGNSECRLFIQSIEATTHDLFKYFTLSLQPKNVDQKILLEARLRLLIANMSFLDSLFISKKEASGSDQIYLTNQSHQCLNEGPLREKIEVAITDQETETVNIFLQVYGQKPFSKLYSLSTQIARMDLKKAERDVYLQPAKLFIVTGLGIVTGNIAAAGLTEMTALNLITARAATLLRWCTNIAIPLFGIKSILKTINDYFENQILTSNQVQTAMKAQIEFTHAPLESTEIYSKPLLALTQNQEKTQWPIVELISRIQQEVGIEKAIVKCKTLNETQTRR